MENQYLIGKAFEMSIGVILVCLLELISILSLILLLQNRKVRRIREVLEEQEKALMSQMEILQEEQENLEKSKKEIRDMITEWMERGENSMECPATESTIIVQEIQNEILKDMQDEKTLQYWTDPVLNTIFLRKLEECRETGADVTITGVPEQGFPLLGKSIAEMIGLFSNLFDNAIEACQLLPEEERWIHITAKEGKKKWIFIIENSCGERSLRKKGEKTWKKNKDDHGIGKDIIYDIVNRNRGWIEFRQENGVHRVEMMLPQAGTI